MVTNTCVVCGGKFTAKRSSHKTCSKKCFYKLLSIGKMGELNPLFNNGKRQYRRIMSNVLACQNCGRQYSLETHHKDGNRKNNNTNNLIKVCRRCHMLLDNRLVKNLVYNHSRPNRPMGGGLK